MCTAANFSDIVNPAMHLHWMYAPPALPCPAARPLLSLGLVSQYAVAVGSLRGCVGVRSYMVYFWVLAFIVRARSCRSHPALHRCGC